MARKPTASGPALFDQDPPAHALAAPATLPPAWTPAQLAVIEHVEGDLLVSAAAGSGKTAVLAQRCARLVTMDNPRRTQVDRLLVLTFTEAAAAEMRGRIAAAIRTKIAQLRGAGLNPDFRRNLLAQSARIDAAGISTLHGFCARTLRNYFHDAALDPAFEILDEQEARLLQDEVLDDLLRRWHQLPDGDPRAAPFADFYEAYGQGRDADIKSFIGDVHAMLASVKSPADWLAAAQDACSPAGAQRLLDAYATRIADHFDLLSARSLRSIRDLRHDGLDALAAPLAQFSGMVSTQVQHLRQDKSAAWDRVAAAIRAFEFPTVRKPADFPPDIWNRHKDDTLEKFRSSLRTLKEFTFALPREKMLADLTGLAQPADVLIRLTLDFQTAYHALKQQQNRLDFSDLERLTLDLLCRPQSAARHDLRQRYDHILVDEFQDINPLQEALLDELRNPDMHHTLGNLFVVGDIKQSIYAFRLADPHLFARRQEFYRKLTTHTACIHLQNNFRSLPHLLENMNAIFSRLLTKTVAGIDYADGHELRPPEPPPSPLRVPSDGVAFTGRPIELHLALTDAPDEPDPREQEDDADSEPAALSKIEIEARMVGTRIAELMQAHHCVRDKSGQARPLRYRDIAILLRGMKNRAHIFARILTQMNIPVHADLGSGYFDAPEVRDTLSLLETLDNPLQDIPLTAAMLSPFGRFTHDDLARIRLAYPNKTQVPFHLAVARYPQEHADAADDADLASRLNAFFDLLARYRTLARHNPLHEALAEIYQDSGIRAYAAGLPAGTQRVANLQMLHQRALQFSNFRKQGLYRFLKFIQRLRQADGDFGEAPVLSQASDVIRIMSIHKSKGLEFPVVFLSALGTKLNLRAGRSGPVLVQRDLHIALQVADVKRNIFYHSAASKSAQQEADRSARAEELRLLYVAMTRARDHLILTGSARQATVDAIRQRWAAQRGPLPADVLLDAQTCLDWLLPVAAMGDVGAAWPDGPVPTAPLAVMVHHIPPAAAAPPAAPSSEDSQAAYILARRPLPDSAPDDVVRSLIDRLDGRYRYAGLTEAPALLTVTELKNRTQLAPSPDEPATAPVPGTLPVETLSEPAWLRRGADGGVPKTGNAPASGVDPIAALSLDPYAARGIATHRFLQFLNFAAVNAPEDLPTQRDLLILNHKITAAEAALVHLDDIAWFLLHQPLGRQLRTLPPSEYPSAALAGGPTNPPQQVSAQRMFREIAFTYALAPDDGPAAQPGEPLSRQDYQQIRGIIDLLLVSPAGGQIIDYKTDHAHAIPERLPMYQRQMRYYMRAAADILQLPVPKASLIFLSARTIEEVV